MSVVDETLTDAEVLELVGGAHLATITVVGADGFAHSTPVWYLPEPEGSVTVLIDPSSVKARILRRDPRATVLIVNNSDGGDRWVMYRGNAEVSGDGIDDLMIRISTRYMGDVEGKKYAASYGRPLPFVAVKLVEPRLTSWKSPFTG